MFNGELMVFVQQNRNYRVNLMVQGITRVSLEISFKRTIMKSNNNNL